jgi:hypothetical protein
LHESAQAMCGTAQGRRVLKPTPIQIRVNYGIESTSCWGRQYDERDDCGNENLRWNSQRKSGPSWSREAPNRDNACGH